MAAMISVILPTRDRPEELLAAVDSVLGQNLPGDGYELIVVDNSQGGEAAESLDSLQADALRRLQILHEPEPGLLAGRHRGAAAASGDILVFTDDDIIADENWLKSIGQAFTDPEIHLVTGPSRPRFQGDPPEWLDGFWTDHRPGRSCGYLSLLDLGDEIREIDPAYVWGLNFAIRRQAFDNLGGFHPDALPWDLRRFRGDGENGIVLGARKRGLKALYHPQALVYHVIAEDRLREEYFLRRAYLQGISHSYMEIREQGMKSGTPLRTTAEKVCRKLRETLGRLQAGKRSDGGEDIRRRTDRAFKDGYRFHRREVASDPDLLAWVLKPDYRDFRLPSLKG